MDMTGSMDMTTSAAWIRRTHNDTAPVQVAATPVQVAATER